MTLLAILIALLIDQAKPLPADRVYGRAGELAGYLEARFNAGEWRNGVVAWTLGAGVPVALILVLQTVLSSENLLLLLLLDIGVLYLTVGFRQFSHFFTDIHFSLRADDIDHARQLLAQWRGAGVDRLDSSTVARLAIEEALVSSHHHVLAPIFWFALLGPAGALLYRLALFFGVSWGSRREAEFGSFGEFARQVFFVVDWVPVRLTAAAFAIVGDFEDAVYCWRTQAQRWSDPSTGILLASAGGAIGVRLGMPVQLDEDLANRPELGLGDAADADFMQSTIGLLWRSLVMCLLMLALFWVASWVSK